LYFKNYVTALIIPWAAEVRTSLW